MKLDLGAGKNPREGFTPVDSIKFTDATLVVNLAKKLDKPDLFQVGERDGFPVYKDYQYARWPWDDNSIEEVNASHVLEHFERRERVHFMNELYRVLKKDGKATITTPHWASNRAYGDMTHCWPPVSEIFFYYLDKNWRKVNCPHDDSEFNPEGYSCDFAATWGYSLRQDLLVKSPEYQQFALSNYKETCTDTIATLVARKVTL